MYLEGIAKGLFFIAIGIFAILGAVKKPRFFWGARKAKSMRRIFGDRITSIFYIAIGIFLSGFGITMFFAG
ncbi:hypothetical protein SAMN02745945_02180 [Peptoclostridium litorale DSM 5388]|uniref:Uncharacterized protein n=1 Tax=Peptoclostridium litorale DSM 5388 TaxID=1121324 RepID=A0A069RFJ0_PEPLI|nr:hypothetical protein [Peptoclostridium litorale]KDR95804.1 hypothetical protein CLIT_10c05320 [Peptoclostridium litorale DSM 5388]SIO20981.1 hypothetical protein SAMN02745945_02180 [Peptoclostridium litorale DSM 5388]